MPEDMEIELRVSLRDMGADDALDVLLPSRYLGRTLGDMVGEVFPASLEARDSVTDLLDTQANPDLPEIYAALLEAFDQWRRGESALHFYAADGREVLLSESVKDLVGSGQAQPLDTKSPTLLELSVERVYDVFATYAYRGGDVAELSEWLRGNTLLYFIDKHDAGIEAGGDDGVSPILGTLGEKGFVVPSDVSGRYVITKEGRQLLGDMIAETESYIDKYDVFKDVSCDLDGQLVEFGTGRGDDLRVQVYDAEGLDPIRTVFLLRMYDGTLDAYAEVWRERIHEDELFTEILLPVLDYDSSDFLDTIIESGFAYQAEQSESAREDSLRQDALRRMRGE